MADGSQAALLATGAMLRELLTVRSAYRQLWRSRTTRLRDGDLNLASIARVIAEHLWESGERPDSELTLARDIKDRVRRALSGEVLSAETLTWFIQAFDMDEADERALWTRYSAGQAGGRVGISNTVSTQRAMARRQWHRTLALFERYWIASDGSLAERNTLHTIMALESGVDKYLFNHEPSVEKVEVVHGGTLGRRYYYGGGLVGDDIVLEQPLRQGDTTSLEYKAFYISGACQATEIRRPARARSENIDIAVRFDERRLPRHVWWSVWTDHYEGAAVSEELVPVSGDGMYRRFVPFIEQTVVGFRWDW